MFLFRQLKIDQSLCHLVSRGVTQTQQLSFTQASGASALGSFLYNTDSINCDTKPTQCSPSFAIKFQSIRVKMFKLYKISDRVNIKSRYYETRVSYKINLKFLESRKRLSLWNDKKYWYLWVNRTVENAAVFSQQICLILLGLVGSSCRQLCCYYLK